MAPAQPTTPIVESQEQNSCDRSADANEPAQPIVNDVLKRSAADPPSESKDPKQSSQSIADDISRLNLQDSCPPEPSKLEDTSRPTADNFSKSNVKVGLSNLEYHHRPTASGVLPDGEEPANSTVPTIHLYAELLFNIHSITLFASLNSPSTLTRPTIATLYTNGSTITIAHDDQSASITLPAPNIGKAEGELPMPAGRPKDVTLRLQVDGETARNVTEGSGGGGGNLVPWGARDLEEARVRVGCRYCGVKIVSGGKMGDKIGVKEWRDLPSESWAEMMEFWHCHKPDSGDHGDDLRKNGDVQEKGYAASNAIRAVEGVGLVDMSSFLLHDKDVLSIREAHRNNEDTPPRLRCSNCNKPLGIHDPKATGYRLFKWHLTLTVPQMPNPTQNPTLHTPTPLHDLGLETGPPTPPPHPPDHHPPEKWITSQLLSSTETNGTRKFLIHPQPNHPKTHPATPSLLWLFTPDLLFFSSTSTSTAGGTPQTSSRACKILWKSVSDASNPDPQANSDSNGTAAPSLEQLRQSPQTDEIELPDPQTLIPALWDALRGSQELLPESMRIWQGWNVGLLRRFDGVDVGGQAGEGGASGGEEAQAQAGEGERGMEEEWREVPEP